MGELHHLALWAPGPGLGLLGHGQSFIGQGGPMEDFPSAGSCGLGQFTCAILVKSASGSGLSCTDEQPQRRAQCYD